MRRIWWFGLAVAALTAAVVVRGPLDEATTLRAQAPAASATQARQLIDTYCVGCHSSAVRAGGVAFDALRAELTADTLHQYAGVWEKTVRKLRGRLMPPPGSRQPEQREIDAFVAWTEAALDRAAARAPAAGHVGLQRLTRTEFAAAVGDLLAIELDPTQLLPAEIEVDGFENVAAALSVSPAFLDQYVAAARHAAKLAVGESVPKLTSVFHPQPLTADQPAHVDGLPLGTRGGMTFRHHFPADGEYRFTIPDLGVTSYARAVETAHTLLIIVDGREVFRGAIGGPDDMRRVDRGGAPGQAEVMKRFANIPVQIKAGTYDVAVTFLERARVESDEFVQFLPPDEFSRGDRAPRVQAGVQVAGPFNSPGTADTPSRRTIFVCRPQSPDDRACARRIASTLARRAFRRPVTAAEVESLMAHFDTGRKGLASPKPSPEGGLASPKPPGEGGFDAGVEHVVAAVLASPDFLFRAIRGGGDGSTAVPLTDLELASRLSFFLWSQGPDDPLLDAAVAGTLRTPATLRAQAQRLLGDPRARRLVRNFALKWLDVDSLAEVVPDPTLFPTFTNTLRDDLATEIELFVGSVLLEDRSVGDLLTAADTFLNDRLATHYGIPAVFGSQFRRVRLESPRRWGLLGKGAVLLRTSYGDRTSPVLRGAWIMDKLMGTPPTPPPPDVETNLSTPKGEVPKTLRARLEHHRSKPGCAQCHGVIDPIGLALENFDAIGRWRDVDADATAPIDAATVLPDGRKVDGPAALRQALFDGRDLFVRAFTEKLMMYALGRELEPHDMPQARAIVRQAAARDYRLSAIVAGIVSSDAFRLQAASVTATAGQGAAGEAATPATVKKE